jgi:hypothetical protein
MSAASIFRAEAARLREFALTMTDAEVLAELGLMIDEWERRARLLGNGDAGGDESGALPITRRSRWSERHVHGSSDHAFRRLEDAGIGA